MANEKIQLKHFFTFIFILLLSGVSSAQNGTALKQDIKTDLVYLSSDYLEGRESGKEGARMAADYIARRFEQIGLEPKGTDDTWFHEFDFNYYPNPHSKDNPEPRKGRNVVGYLDNGAVNTIIIGAHYDHLGMGISGSLHAGEPAIHNGADDNASGVSAMLNLAARLKAGEAKNNNYLFISFSAEELGLIGSKAYADDPTIDFGKVNYMLNLDMVGRLKEEKVLAVGGAGTSPAWKPVLENIQLHGIKVKTTDSGIGPSDHTSFYLKDIPVLFFFTGQHGDYHKPSDDANLINFKGIVEVTNYVMAVINELDASEKLEFTKTKEEATESRRSYKVTLGVMPDYVYDGTGLRIDGVMEGRTAANAGMLAKDVVIKIGDIEIKDIYGYMDALGKFNTGDKTTVVFLRDGKEMKTEVEF
ncbi:MAG: M28 family peptidase [Saprospiraceae bacterium]|nr:M28 family peptidase [Saprospiraceae bacterium]MCB9322612.1 M28 family peptidase [Lewinellaceae bacterium]